VSERPPLRAALAVALLLVTPTLLVRLDYPFDRFQVDLHFSVTLALAALLAALPFLAAGVVIAHAIKTWVVGVAVFVALYWKTEAISAVG
jgi:hypothetical protein